MMEIAAWMILAGIVVLFLAGCKWLAFRALFRTKVLQWAKHQKSQVAPEAAWTWRIALLLVLAAGIGEFRKLGSPLLSAEYGLAQYLGFVLVALGLWSWLAAMDARKQYFWFFQILAPGEKLAQYSTDGIYASVRNPRDLGFVLVVLGLALALSLKFTIAFGVLFLIATCFRVNSRDRILIEKYGKQYIDYSRSTKKLIPYLY
jgi:protein-S-isoprenylcysteine O-methyltransferase Ste14